MPGPFIYIGTFTLERDKRQEAREALRRLVDVVEANEPRLIGFNVYLDEEGATASVVQIHPDPDSMEFHMKVISEHLAGASGFLEGTVSEQIYGRPTPSLADLLARWAVPGVPVTSMPDHEAGFLRAAAG